MQAESSPAKAAPSKTWSTKSLLAEIDSPKDLRKLPREQLEDLAAEMRRVIVNQVATKGGHLASNLGSIELAIALHRVYNTPEDKLIWDVGHQAYPHKLLTGRYKKFHTIKQHGGLSGFLKRSESEYDVFGAGHASTSLAAAMGMAVGRSLEKKNNRVVAVIGDGAMTGGMAYEALNNAGVSKEKITIILNDNRMSIAPNVGGLHKYLTRILSNPTYNRLKDEVWQFTGKLPNVGEGLQKIVRKVDESVKHLVMPGGFFEDLGIRYFGPVDGHDLDGLLEVMNHLKDYNRPCLIHVVTEKGRGFDKAEKDSYKWHASAPFDIKSGEKKKAGGPPSLAQVFGQTLLEAAREDEKIIAITAAMPDGVSVDIMQKEIPERVYDVGIAEQYAVTFAAGLACEGLKPVVAIYSTFLQRAIDQVIHDVAIQNLNVKFVMSHGGLVGLDGPTHHGAMDLTYLRMVPGMVIMAPSDETELRNAFNTLLKYNKGPIAMRFPKGSAAQDYQPAPMKKWRVGIPKIIEEGEGLLILAVGSMLSNAKAAVEHLKLEGFNPTLVDVRFVKPLDEKTYAELFQKHQAVLTVEDNVVNGGYGSGVSELMTQLDMSPLPIKHIGIPDKFVTHGDIPKLQAALGLDDKGIVKAALQLMRVVQTNPL